MFDLSNFEVEIKKPLTNEEIHERVKKGLIKSGDIVESYDSYGNIIKVEIGFLPFPDSKDIKTIKELKKDNWENKEKLIKIYKYHKSLWDFMKENNIIPENIINEVENNKYIDNNLLILDKLEESIAKRDNSNL